MTKTVPNNELIEMIIFIKTPLLAKVLLHIEITITVKRCFLNHL